jgi:valyl-tRNA synthetase
LASEKLYHYAWHTFADEVLEESKPLLDDEATKHARQYVLRVILRDLLKLLHPFMPFVTEMIWQELPFKERGLLMVETWPLNNDT